MKWLRTLIVGSLLVGVGTCNINVTQPPSQTIYSSPPVIYYDDYYYDDYYYYW